jgi:citrate lyase subunit beta/citryl-CoA lyase
MRSLLFVPGDSEKKLAKSLGSDADVLIVDLEDSVVAGNKAVARRITHDFLAAKPAGPKLFVRVNPLASGMILDDLAAIVGAAPAGIVVPKAAGGDDMRRLDHYLSALEVREGVAPSSIATLPIASETATAMFTFQSYAGSSARLCGIMWGCEDLAADVGAAENRTAEGAYLEPFRLARSLCLFAAAAAGVAAIDTVFTDFRDDAGLARESREAERTGFTAKAAIHPAQIAAINRAFTPDEAAIAWARRVVAAFAADPQAGVIGLDGKMLDRPHLRVAERVLARALSAAPG